MNRNTESHFSQSPTLGISRSKFDRSFTHKTTFNTGDLIPIYCDATIMPGDTVKMRMSEVVRMATPICPVMDNANLDLYFFFVPYRLIWDHFKRFMGENDTAPWIQQTEYEIPQIAFPTAADAGGSAGWHKGDIADYLGYPTEISRAGASLSQSKNTASVLPFRAYCLIWNEFFRDENLQNPVNIENSIDALISGISGYKSNYDPVIGTCRGGAPLKVCKYHDYFTSALPGAQKGPAVNIPLGDSAPIKWSNSDTTLTADKKYVTAMHIPDETITGGIDGLGWDTTYPGSGSSLSRLADNKQMTMYADLSQAVGASVNQLRQAFAIQKFYERQALGGTRYIEMVKSHFDVTNPDYRLQRPEYLGGKRIPININQVVQNSPYIASESTTPLGTTGAYSLTSDRDDMFTHSFTEHGILMGLCAVRTVHTYQQGLNRQYSKRKFTDFYFPEFANLGNQAILNKEIYIQDTGNEQYNDQAFGYQEAWACERYFPDIVTGEMRSNYSLSLDVWHYADKYNQLPSLGDSWIQETKENVARTLAVQEQDQFIADFYFGAIYTRPMPLYSIPGLIDHH